MSGFTIQNIIPQSNGLSFENWSFSLNPASHWDTCLEETPELIIGLEGAVLNLSTLRKEYGQNTTIGLIEYLWKKQHTSFPDVLYGDFTLFVFDKNHQKLHFFTNQTGTNQVFYIVNGTQMIISSNIFMLQGIAKRSTIPLSLNVSALYAMMTFGGMLHNDSPLEGIKRLLAGERLSFSTQEGMKVSNYHDYNAILYQQRSEKETLNTLDELFMSALQQEYQKDLEHHKKHIATLSGGLDSRMNVMLAHQQGFQIDKAFCFSEKEYLDVTIANQITTDLNIPFQFVPLNGDYAAHIEENTKTANGCVFYLGSAHFAQALPQVAQPEHGLIHTGQMGDGVLGGFNSRPERMEATLSSKTIYSGFMDRIDADYKDVANQYSNEETFKLYNRAFNMVNFGSLVCRKHSFLVSPFMHPAFIDFCLSIPPKDKYRQAIYLKWMMQKHAETTKYTWENLLVKPDALWKLDWGYYKLRFKNAWYKKVIGTDRHTTMNPFQYWMSRSPQTVVALHTYFRDHIDLLDVDPQLKRDSLHLFTSGNMIQKAAVLTNIAFIKVLNA